MTNIPSAVAFLRAIWPWMYRDEDPEDYPEGTNWQPVDLFKR